MSKKYDRKRVASICKSERGDYIKFATDINIKKGDILNLESKADRIKSISAAMEKGSLSADLGQKMLSDVESNWKDFVRFEIIKVTKLG